MKHPVKDQARLLAAHLQAKHNITLKHGQALNALSAAFGHADWNAAAAQGLTDAAVPLVTHTPFEHAIMDVRFTPSAAQKWLDQAPLPSGLGQTYPFVTDIDAYQTEVWSDHALPALDYLHALLYLAYPPREDPETYFGAYWLARACAEVEDLTLEGLIVQMAAIISRDDDGPGELDSWENDLLTESPEACYERLVRHAQRHHDVVALRVFIRKSYVFTALCRPRQLPKKAVPAEIDRGPMDGDREAFRALIAARDALLRDITDELLEYLSDLGYDTSPGQLVMAQPCFAVTVSFGEVPPTTLFIFTGGVMYRPASDEAARILHEDLCDAATHVRLTVRQKPGAAFSEVKSLAGAPWQVFEQLARRRSEFPINMMGLLSFPADNPDPGT